MNRIFILLLAIILIVGCSNSRMELRDCLSGIKQKDEHYLIIDKKLKSMGFEFAKEYQPSLTYERNLLGRTYYFGFTDPKKKWELFSQLYAFL